MANQYVNTKTNRSIRMTAFTHICYMQSCQNLTAWPRMFCDKCTTRGVVIDL